ncbi:GNAT family N-acetyltransferase [Winogradskyella jejuensis]|uniref:Protein N-acetyltransferase, RimJ/RimL family n=1 Tax=Winogradskyella jejuensis TaxID=1089305 RepID=A0A1M5UPG6_9FLAO|nr:GNAT family protein [Winogradskyella jejuensis]SHH64806.1 Protein N-acetyltransferase, RimJ/RimL family [Winogradskyella jejuensis]
MQFDNYRIRLLKNTDLEAYYGMVSKNRKRLEDFFTGTTSRTQTFEDTKVFLAEMLERVNKREYYPYLIEDINTNTIAGFLDLKNVDWKIPKTEMGLYIDEDYADKGVSSKAFKLFCDYCFDTHGFKKLFLRTHPQNYPARKIAEKAGFKNEGTIRCDYKTTSGDLIDLVYYGKLSNE